VAGHRSGLLLLRKLVKVARCSEQQGRGSLLS
jgi:hypothetical protein